MEFSNENPNHTNLPHLKFETMLKTNRVLFFDADEFETIIHHYLNDGKIALAKKAIKLGLEQHPSSISLQLFQAEVLVFENQLDAADELLNKLYKIDTLNEDIFIQKANVLSKKNNHKKAITILKEALHISEENQEIYALIGMEYLFLDNFEKAKKYFSICVNNDAQDYASLYNLMYCYDYLKQHPEAIVFLNTYLDTYPYSETAWHQLGLQYYSIKQYEKALTAFDFAVISDDTFIGAYLEKGKVLEKLHRYNEAIENYTITLQLNDPTPFALLRLGYCYEKLGTNDIAIQYYTKTIKEDPLLDKGWIAITKFYVKKNDFKKALYYINKAINTDTENVNYWKLYAQINQNLQLLEEAERGYKRTIELGNYEVDTWVARGDLLIQLGEPQAAIYNFLQALEFHPEHAEIEYRLGGLYCSILEVETGIFYLKNALKNNPEYAFIIPELFPKVFSRKNIKKLLKQK